MNQMLFLFNSLLATFLIVSGKNIDNSRRCWSSGNGQSARWWDEGEQVDRGLYWYECVYGKLKPQGCFSGIKRLNIGGRFIKGGYEQECYIGNEGYLRFRYTACVAANMTRYSVGQSWADDLNMFYFECRQDGPYLRVEIGGCMAHNGSRRVPVGDNYVQGDYIYECQTKHNGSVQMCSVGCVHNGVRYKIGQSWPDGEFIYYCKMENGRCRKICVGCQYNNKALYDGDRYHKQETVFQCEVRTNSHLHRPIGCLVKDNQGDTIERTIGCKWYEEQSGSKVEVICRKDDQRNSTYVETIGCIYVVDGFDTLFIKPNTYTIWTTSADKISKAIACSKNANDEYRLETFSTEKIGRKTVNLSYDHPKGK